jgi:phage terminase small subunit
MGLSKKLTEKQIRFAQNICCYPTWSLKKCAIEAGYSKNRAAIAASELRNPELYPLVNEYIDKIREKSLTDYKQKLNQMFGEITILINQAKEDLKKEYNSKKYTRVVKVGGKIAEVFDMMGYRQALTTVYLAEETRPYKTNHYKIGKTSTNVFNRSTGRTDNPFGLNYICFFEYVSNNKFNLEATLQNFFKNYSTYNSKYDTSASEWFSFKKRKFMIKWFEKMGYLFLRKNQCLHKFTMFKDGGYYKK